MMVRMNLNIAAVIGACVLIFSACCLDASPSNDLASPSQDARDAAAKIVRETYAPPSRTSWDFFLKALKLGTSQAAVEKQLESSNFASAGELGGPGGVQKWYRLDDLWLLGCSFTNTMSGLTNRALAEVDFKEQMRDIWVQPPANFTGIWRTYWVNGQPNNEFHYTNGRPAGIFTSFYPTGSKSVISPQRNGVPDGEEVGFYPSGKIKYKGRYKAGRQVDHWIWYKEDGSVESEKDYDHSHPNQN